MEDHTKMLRLE